MGKKKNKIYMLNYFKCTEKIFCTLLIYILLTGCISTSIPQDVYSRLSNKITAQYIKQVRNEGKFSLVGMGGRVADDVQITYLTFQTVAIVNITNARKLIIEKEEEFLELLNGMQEIRPHLHHYPSGPEALELVIGFIDVKRSFVLPPHIALVSIYNNKIHYKIFEITNRSFTTVYSEPYEKGYKIVYGREKE